MKLGKVKEYFDKLSADDFLETLGALARSLGHELSKNDLKKLAEFRSISARTIPEGKYIRNLQSENGYVRGYVAALCDVTAAYEAAVTTQVENQEMVDVLRGYLLDSLVVALSQEEVQAGPATAQSLAVYLLTEFISVTKDDDTEAVELYSTEQVEKNLAMLCSGNFQLVESFGEPPEKFYRLTLRGEDVAEMLKFEDE
jgi:hypothetical protein